MENQKVENTFGAVVSIALTPLVDLDLDPMPSLQLRRALHVQQETGVLLPFLV